MKNKTDIAKVFLDGYQQIRRLNHDEICAIPYYEIISVIWVMAINVKNADLIGHKWLEQPFWDRKFSILKELDKMLT
jgi:hypothetical protein